ncbi:glycosyltransferase family 4 protein [Mycobacterium sp. OAE908]|uniref:glycosyltransferase family 4 protein n=1 Tax=Mycobacterium sp. OAE908 TaxID=2817899 RepID=UPI001AE1A040
MIGVTGQDRVGIITSQAFSVVNFRGPLISELVKIGVAIYALAPDYTEDLKRQVRELGAEPVDYSLSRAGLNPISDAKSMFSMIATVRRLRLDAVLTYHIKPVIYGSIAAVIARVPNRYAMIEGLGYLFLNDPDSGSKSRAVMRWVATNMYRLSLFFNRRVFFENEDDPTRFRHLGVVKPTQIVVLDGIGVDLEHYPVKHDFPPPTTFILVARMLRTKGVRDYVDAARIVCARYPTSRFILVGQVDVNPDSITASELQTWVDEGIVEWTGHVPDVRVWLAQASVFVLPSYGEGKPRSTLEAMASGLPIITTDCSGCRETVEEGVNGLLVPVHDPKALAKAMIRFVEDPALAKEFGRMSRQIAERRFDIHEANTRIMRALGYG